MTGQSGVKSFVGVGKLNAPTLTAAKAARTAFSGLHSGSIKVGRKKIPLGSTRRPDVEEFATDRHETTFEFEVEGSTEGILPLVLNSLLAVVPTSTQQGATAAYLHEWVGVGDTTPNAARLSIEKRDGTIDDSELINGVVDEVQIKWDQEGFIRIRVKGPGSSWEYLAAPSSPTYAAVSTLLSRVMCSFTIDAVTTLPIYGGSVTLRRPRKMDDFTCTSIERRDADFNGEIEFTAEFQALAEDLTWLRRYLGGAAVTAGQTVEAYVAANVKIEHPTVIADTHKPRIEVDLPRCVVLLPEEVPINGKDYLLQTVKVQATYNSGTTRSITTKIMNTLTSI